MANEKLKEKLSKNRLKSVTSKHIAQENKEYVDARRKGLITSLKSKYPRLDSKTMGGFENNTICTFGAMSGAGKSTIAKSVTDSFYTHNPDKKFKMVYFNFEMVSHQMAGRSIVTQRKIKLQDLYSVDKPLSDEEFQELESYYENLSRRDAEYVEVTGTADQIYNTLLHIFIETVEKDLDTTLVYIIDHTLLTKGKDGEKEKDRIDSLMMKLLEFKKVVKASNGSSIGFVLSQLNRDNKKVERIQNKDMHRPLTSDIFGASSVEQASDYIIVNHIPAKLNIRNYTSNDFPTVIKVIENGEEKEVQMAYFEILKNRSGEPDVTIPMWNNLEFFDFDEMEMEIFNDLWDQSKRNEEPTYEKGQQQSFFKV